MIFYIFTIKHLASMDKTHVEHTDQNCACLGGRCFALLLYTYLTYNSCFVSGELCFQNVWLLIECCEKPLSVLSLFYDVMVGVSPCSMVCTRRSWAVSSMLCLVPARISLWAQLPSSHSSLPLSLVGYIVYTSALSLWIWTITLFLFCDSVGLSNGFLMVAK